MSNEFENECLVFLIDDLLLVFEQHCVSFVFSSDLIIYAMRFSLIMI